MIMHRRPSFHRSTRSGCSSTASGSRPLARPRPPRVWWRSRWRRRRPPSLARAEQPEQRSTQRARSRRPAGGGATSSAGAEVRGRLGLGWGPEGAVLATGWDRDLRGWNRESQRTRSDAERCVGCGHQSPERPRHRLAAPTELKIFRYGLSHGYCLSTLTDELQYGRLHAQSKVYFFLMASLTSHTHVIPSGKTARSPALTSAGLHSDQAPVGVTITWPSST